MLAEALCDSLEKLYYEGMGVNIPEVNACFTEMVRLELSVYSGRPNPYRILSPGESELFIEAVQCLKTRVPPLPPMPKLGGCSAAWETGCLVAQDGVVALYRGAGAEPVHYADDIIPSIESLVRTLVEDPGPSNKLRGFTEHVAFFDDAMVPIPSEETGGHLDDAMDLGLAPGTDGYDALQAFVKYTNRVEAALGPKRK